MIVAIKSLAIKYRPKSFDDVVEQGSIKIILQQQLEANETKNAYLFCGGAGTGKTTCARIFANEINKGQGNPIEMDAASNSGVEDVRMITQQAKTQSLDSEYKVFIIDECHSISNTGWQAFLKLIEEPPAKSIFIFCTTDPQKIPKTILSRVQRYDFQRISHEGVVNRLKYILVEENVVSPNWEHDALDYIAKIADGGMRDAITLMDKCLAYSTDLTIENVLKALGTVDYDTMFWLTDSIITNDVEATIKVIEDVHRAGKDLKQFIKTYTNFVLDLCKYGVLKSFDLVNIPNTYEDRMNKYNDHAYEDFNRLLSTLVKLNADIKWETSPKPVIESVLLLRCVESD
jgi:DNA polymerase-3 subunit gamma/tau